MATLDTILKQLLLCLLIRTKVDFLIIMVAKEEGIPRKKDLFVPTVVLQVI